MVSSWGGSYLLKLPCKSNPPATGPSQASAYQVSDCNFTLFETVVRVVRIRDMLLPVSSSLGQGHAVHPCRTGPASQATLEGRKIKLPWMLM